MGFLIDRKRQIGYSDLSNSMDIYQADTNVKNDELGKLHASISLLARLEEGEESARVSGWVAADDAEAAE